MRNVENGNMWSMPVGINMMCLCPGPKWLVGAADLYNGGFQALGREVVWSISFSLKKQ